MFSYVACCPFTIFNLLRLFFYLPHIYKAGRDFNVIMAVSYPATTRRIGAIESAAAGVLSALDEIAMRVAISFNALRRAVMMLLSAFKASTGSFTP